MIMNIVGGLALMLAGFSLVGRAILLSGRRPGWPTAPLWLRGFIEVGGISLIAEGVVVLIGRYPAGVVVLAIALTVAAVELATFINLVRQRRSRFLKGIFS